MDESAGSPEARGAPDLDESSPYRVALDVFTGPLDLLLHLVREDEVELEQIPVSRIADQYVAYLEQAHGLDLDVAAEFLALASTLLEMKSRALLPRELAAVDDEEQGPDPQEQLVRMLLQYRRYKHLAFRLEALAERRALRYARPGPLGLPTEAPGPPLAEVSLEDLRAAFSRRARETLVGRSRTIFFEDLPIATYIAQIRDVVLARRAVLLSDLAPPGTSRPTQIGTFLGLLELIRGHEVGVEQMEPFGDVRIFMRTDRPAEAPPTDPDGAAPADASAKIG
jgi:segregation and condensation protein A